MTKTYRNHRSIRVLRPRFDDQFTYEGHALKFGFPHGPDSCFCLACADARDHLGMAPLVPELEQRAERMRLRDVGLDILVSAGVGSLFGSVLTLWFLGGY